MINHIGDSWIRYKGSTNMVNNIPNSFVIRW